MGVLVAKVSFSLAPEPGEDFLSHASLHAWPNPDPVSHRVHFFYSRSRGSLVELVSSEPGRAFVQSGSFLLAFKVFAAAKGEPVLARAIACVCC